MNACRTHCYRGINNALSNLQPWPGSSRSKPTKKTCTVRSKEKGKQREKATDKQMQRTRASGWLGPTPPAAQRCPIPMSAQGAMCGLWRGTVGLGCAQLPPQNKGVLLKKGSPSSELKSASAAELLQLESRLLPWQSRHHLHFHSCFLSQPSIMQIEQKEGNDKG